MLQQRYVLGRDDLPRPQPRRLPLQPCPCARSESSKSRFFFKSKTERSSTLERSLTFLDSSGRWCQQSHVLE